MKKLTAIMKAQNFTDKLFGLRKKQVKTAISAANNDIEEQSTDAAIKYESLMKQLGDKSERNYKDILNEMLRCKDIIKRAAETKRAMDEIEADLNSEVEIEA